MADTVFKQSIFKQSPTPAQWLAWDAEYIWHPYTQAQTAGTPLYIERAQGLWLHGRDAQGNTQRYGDLVSSWWVNLHGHAHPQIAQAIAEQAQQLEQVMFAGFTHQPAIQLAQQLATVLPGDLSRTFFSDNGSTAVEIALKVAYQYWRNLNPQAPARQRFLALEGAYHGDTFGAMSTGASCGFFEHFKPLFFQVDTLPVPTTWQGDRECQQKEQQSLDWLAHYLKNHAHDLNAFIVEPLIQGASGMRVFRPEFLRAVVEAVQAHAIPVIFDEVMTAFGRTGSLFACQQADVVPDMVCLSKGLTGGFLPLATTVVTPRLYEVFLGETFQRALAHGHSFAANPLGCAAALASLQLLLQPDTQATIHMIQAIHTERLAQLSARLPIVQRPRICGTMAAWQLGTETHYGHPLGMQLRQYCQQHGWVIRPLGNVVYLLPPYCITADELHAAYDVLQQGIAQLKAGVSVEESVKMRDVAPP